MASLQVDLPLHQKPKRKRSRVPFMRGSGEAGKRSLNPKMGCKNETKKKEKEQRKNFGRASPGSLPPF